MFCAINNEESHIRNEELSEMVDGTETEDLEYYFTGNFCKLITKHGRNKSESKAKSHLITLHRLIKKPTWDAAMDRLEDSPQEAKVWVCWINGRGKSVQYLPLHLACRETNKQQYQLVELLIHIYPKAARTKDHAGRLPLHHLCLGATSSPTLFQQELWKDIIHIAVLLLSVFPEAMFMRDDHNNIPIKIVSEAIHLHGRTALTDAIVSTFYDFFLLLEKQKTQLLGDIAHHKINELTSVSEQLRVLLLKENSSVKSSDARRQRRLVRKQLSGAFHRQSGVEESLDDQNQGAHSKIAALETLKALLIDTNETGREKDNMGENFNTPLPSDVTLQSNKETMMTCIVEDQNHETHNIPNQDMDFGRSTLSFSSEERVTNFTLTKDSTLHSPSEEKKIFEKSKTLSHIESNYTNAPTRTLFFPASDVKSELCFSRNGYVSDEIDERHSILSPQDFAAVISPLSPWTVTAQNGKINKLSPSPEEKPLGSSVTSKVSDLHSCRKNLTFMTPSLPVPETKNNRRNSDIIWIVFIILSIILLCILVPPSAFMKTGPKSFNFMTFIFRPIGTRANSSCAFYESALIEGSSRIFQCRRLAPS